MRITTDDGVGLEVEVTGEGPGLVLVHGFGGAKEDFTDHVPALAANHTVVIFDHRGHGASDKPDAPDAYSLDRLAADVLLVADAAGLDTFRLLGHSMGGMVSRRLLLSNPERIEAFIMMDTSLGPIPGFDPALMDAAAEVAVTRGKDALKELLDLAPVLMSPAYERVLAERPGYQEFQDKKWADLSPVMWGTMVTELGHQSDDLAAVAAVLDCPLLILVGEQDKPFVTASRLAAEAIPSAQLVILPDAGHSPQFENPQAWYDAFNGFLSSLPARTR
jgi:pimeloyl-ACP methyl ester carboxylesterase